MTQNPFLNAVAALAYILGIACVLFLASIYLPEQQGFPILGMTLFISLFVMSAAAMGYIFLSYPIGLYLDGKKKEGIKLFLETLGAFAGLVLAFALVASVFFY